ARSAPVSRAASRAGSGRRRARSGSRARRRAPPARAPRRQGRAPAPLQVTVCYLERSCCCSQRSCTGGCARSCRERQLLDEAVVEVCTVGQLDVGNLVEEGGGG